MRVGVHCGGPIGTMQPPAAGQAVNGLGRPPSKNKAAVLFQRQVLAPWRHYQGCHKL
jgi:hypothetical protein